MIDDYGIDKQVYTIALAFVDFVEQTFRQTGRSSWLWTTKDGERLTCIEHVVEVLLAGKLEPLMKPVVLNVKIGEKNG